MVDQFGDIWRFDRMRYGGGYFAHKRPCVAFSLAAPKGPALLQSYLEVDAAAYARKVWTRDIPLN